MSAEAKITFSARLKAKIEECFPVSETNQIMEMVADCLTGFDVEMQTQNRPSEDDLLNIYMSAMRVSGRSEKTIIRYNYMIHRMLRIIQVPTSDVTIYHLRSYLTKEKARGIADSTLEGTRQVFSAYFNWLQREGLIKTNPTANLSVIKCKKKVKDVYTDIDIERLKQKCKSLRDRAIICFLLSTACRIGEMTKLNIDDIDLNSLEGTVLGKGNKERTIYLDPIAGAMIREYLNNRTDDNDALFVSLRPPYKRFHDGGVRAMLKDLGLQAHVEKVHPHKFRRTKATNLIKHGMPIQEVAAILGHEKLDTTMEYVVMDKSGIKNAYQRYA